VGVPFGVDPCRSSRWGLQRVKISNEIIFAENSNLHVYDYHTSTSQTNRQTDGRTDNSPGNTALRYASRGKNVCKRNLRKQIIKNAYKRLWQPYGNRLTAGACRVIGLRLLFPQIYCSTAHCWYLIFINFGRHWSEPNRLPETHLTLGADCWLSTSRRQATRSQRTITDRDVSFA